MSADSKSARALPTSEPGLSEDYTKSVFHQTEWWLKAPAQFCARMQQANVRWLTHRQRDLDNGFLALRQLAACRDLVEAAVIQQTWLAESMQSVVADWTDLMRPLAERNSAEPRKTKERAVSLGTIPKQAAA